MIVALKNRFMFYASFAWRQSVLPSVKKLSDRKQLCPMDPIDRQTKTETSGGEMLYRLYYPLPALQDMLPSVKHCPTVNGNSPMDRNVPSVKLICRSDRDWQYWTYMQKLWDHAYENIRAILVVISCKFFEADLIFWVVSLNFCRIKIYSGFTLYLNNHRFAFNYVCI